MWWIIIVWVVLALAVFAFNYGSSVKNKIYDYQSKQRIYFEKYVNSQIPTFVKYIGDGILELQCNQYTLITIETTKNNKIKVWLDDATNVLYDDLTHFNYDWRFEDET